MPTMASLYIQTPAEKPLSETICPFILQENWPELLPEGVLEALAKHLAMAESIALTTDKPTETPWASPEETDIQQPFVDEVLAPFDATLPFLECNDNYHPETPSSLLESDDTSQFALEEMLWLDHQDDNTPGLFLEDAGDACFTDDTTQFLDKSFIRLKDSHALRSPPEEEPEALLENRDSVQPGPEESLSSFLRATTVPSPSDMPESVENATARSTIEPAPGESIPGAVSAASDLSQGGDCVSEPSLAVTTDSGIESGDGSCDDEVVFVEERSLSLAEQNRPTGFQNLEAQQTKMDFGGGSNDDVSFVRSRKRKSPSSTEQDRPTGSQNFMAQQSKMESGDGSGDDDLLEERVSPKRARRLSGDQQRKSSLGSNRTKKPGGKKVRVLDDDGEIIFPSLEELIKMTRKEHEEWKRAYTAWGGT